MIFLDFETLFNNTGFIREVVRSRYDKYEKDIVSWFCREGVNVLVNGDTRLDGVTRVCLVDKGDVGVMVYFSSDVLSGFVLGDLLSLEFLSL